MFFGGGMPFDFDDAGGFGGFPGKGGGKGRKPVNTTKYYEVLGVEKNATENEIKKAFRKKAIQHHPDKGGDPEVFKEINTAFSVLSDADKRAAYDRGGEEAVEGGGGGDPSDVFDMFFGGGGGGGGRGGKPKRRKTQDVNHTLQVTLEQVYNGCTKKIAVNREVIDKKAGVKECQECDGRGVRVQVIRMGPMIQQSRQQCPACGGEGKSFRTKKEREVLEVFVEKGSPDGHKITFSGKADEHPDADPGDIIFTVHVKEHAVYKRRGADLYVHKDISLTEALCGFTIELDHLDNRKILAKTSPGDITSPLAINPIAALDGSDKKEWECIEDFDSTSENVAQAETTDLAACKQVCEKKDFSAFVIKQGNAFFKRATREEVVGAKKPMSGAQLWVQKDPNASAGTRMCKALKGEGMPTHKNPFVCGNMFLVLNIVFPESLNDTAVAALKKALPPALNAPKAKEDDPGVEVHYSELMDPVASYEAGKPINTGEAYDEDEERGHRGMGGMGGQQVQCQQQ